MIYRQVLRRALLSVAGADAETAHERTLAALRWVSSFPPVLTALHRYFAVDAPRLAFGLRFPNPVGLAAGMDKDGVALRAWPALGFGYVEAGTVTRYPQQGNPRPRLYRLPKSDAVINRMGFNNDGAAALAARLDRLGPLGVPLGISLGKSKITQNDHAVEDYRDSLRRLYRHGDYFAINVSSPNTPGLRALQDRAALAELIAALRDEVDALARQQGGAPKPLLVKIAPDLTEQATGELIEVCTEHAVSGVIATNTTTERMGIAPDERAIGEQSGGLSGRPLHSRAVRMVRFVYRQTSGRLPIVGVGGIGSAEDALRMLDAGASLLQVYTGLVYSGPGMIRKINRAVSNS